MYILYNCINFLFNLILSIYLIDFKMHQIFLIINTNIVSVLIYYRIDNYFIKKINIYNVK